MEILHLLEVLRSANGVITLKIENINSDTKSFLDYFVLLAPVAVAIISMFFSYLQFSKNLNNQSKQFSKTIIQQIHNVHLTAKLAAEVEAIKEVRNSVRKLSVEFITYISKHKADMYEYEMLRSRSLEHRTDNHQDLVDMAHKLRMESFAKMLEIKSMLETFLTIPNDQAFVDAMINVENAMRDLEDDGVRLGIARGKFLEECRQYLERKSKEINMLTYTSVSH